MIDSVFHQASECNGSRFRRGKLTTYGPLALGSALELVRCGSSIDIAALACFPPAIQRRPSMKSYAP